MSHSSVIGLDLAKHIFQVHGVDEYGEVVLQKQLRRSGVLKYFANHKPCLIGIEASSGMHYWVRALTRLGHTVRAMAPAFVKPYVKGNKNDQNDAEAICEAVQRPSMRFVEAKTPEQQAVLHLHHSRDLLVRQRVSISNHIRGVLAEYGMVLPRGLKAFSQIGDIVEDAENELPFQVRQLVLELKAQHDELIERCDRIYAQIQCWHTSNPNSQLLATIPGVGVLTASALAAHLGDGQVFRNGRHLSAYLGLVPRQASSGGKERLLGISKRGNWYLRCLLVQGAKSVIRHFKRRQAMGQTSGQPWLEQLLKRTHPNKAAVALANKMGRISWVLVSRQQVYQSSPVLG